jgi:predicted DCC family thiol-disulfide oxidoreductase YuxK
MMDSLEDKPMVIYDGVCNLCHGFVRFVLKHEKKAQIHFVAFQHLDEPLKTKLAKSNFENSSVVFIHNNKTYFYSTAALRIAGFLKFPFNFLQVFFLVPPFIRNAVYRFIAANRYKWFGKKDACPIPPKEWLERLK